MTYVPDNLFIYLTENVFRFFHMIHQHHHSQRSHLLDWLISLICEQQGLQRMYQEVSIQLNIVKH